jgi:hypothetical protein
MNMADITVTLTEDQTVYVQQVLNVEQAKIVTDLMLLRMEMAPPTTSEAQAAWAAACKPYEDRQNAISAIMKAFMAAWPKP